MLNNQDFAKLIAQPDFQGKVRFDLKQIETWDKQNDAKLKRKPGSKPSNSEHGDDREEKSKAEKLYRDRAGERRKQTGVSAEESNLEAIAATLDAEQTKFLGGDVEHTHLVKGLDYVLLRRNRDNKPTVDGSSSSHSSETISQQQYDRNTIKQQYQPSSNLVETATKVQINTLFGRNIKMAMDALKTNRNQNTSSSNSITTSAKTTSLKPFVRNAYEFDLNPSSIIDIPTTVLRSKMDIVDSGECVNYITPTSLMEKLSLAIANKAKNKLKRKKIDSYSQQQPNLKKAVVDDTDIYGDIFDNVGKYEPIGSLSAEEKTGPLANTSNSEIGSASLIDTAVKVNQNNSSSSSNISNNKDRNMKGIFNDIYKTTSVYDSASSNNNNPNDNKSHTSTATVADLLAAINKASSSSGTSVNKNAIINQIDDIANANASSSSSGLSLSSFLSKMTSGTATIANTAHYMKVNKATTIEQNKKASSSGIKPASSTASANVIHRDIFGTSALDATNSANKKVLEKGDYLSKKGASYEIEEDDDEGYESDDAKTSKDVGGGSGGGGDKTSSSSTASHSNMNKPKKPIITTTNKEKEKSKHNHGSNSSNSTGASTSGVTSNRAARRAMGGGNK